MNYRRPSNDELTPEDLFRPEPANGNTIPGEVVPASHHDLPWNSPNQAKPQAGGYPEYYGATAAAPAPAPAPDEASTQFMPAFPAEQQPAPYAGSPHGYPQQGHPQQSYPQPDQGYQDQGYQDQGHQDHGYQDRTGSAQRPNRRFSPPVIAAAVVGGCAVLGVIVAVALGGGSGTGAAANTLPSASAGSAKPGAATVGAADGGQAQAMSDLLATAANSRSAVVSAVSGIEHCQNLDQAQTDLTAAAGSRQTLIQQLGTLQTDKLQGGAALVAALQEGWQASASADAHYAAWAAQSKSNCDHKHKPKDGGEKKAGDGASSTATAAKQRASRLWNTIAEATGLPKRGSTQL